MTGERGTRPARRADRPPGPAHAFVEREADAQEVLRLLRIANRVNGRALAHVAVVALLYGDASLASGSLLLCALAAGCGFTWGLLRVAGRSLWPAVLAHAAWALAVLVAWPLA